MNDAVREHYSPAGLRFLAATYGCHVTGVDLSESFVEAARYLTARTGRLGVLTAVFQST